MKQKKRRRVGWKERPWYCDELTARRKILGFQCTFVLTEYKDSGWCPWIEIEMPEAQTEISVNYTGNPITVYQSENWCFAAAKKLAGMAISKAVEDGPLFKTK